MDMSGAEELLRKLWNNVWRDGRFEVVDEIFTEPFIRHSSLGTETTRRRDYQARLREYQRTLARPETSIDDLAVFGDRIWSRATSRGVNLETGEMAVVTWMIVQRLEGDLIAEQWTAVLRNVEWKK